MVGDRARLPDVPARNPALQMPDLPRPTRGSGVHQRAEHRQQAMTDDSRWRIREVSGTLAVGVRFLVYAPGCPILNHPLKRCDCAGFMKRAEATDYVRSKTPSKRDGQLRVLPARSREQRAREHAEWLAWKASRDTHRCGDCGATSTLRGLVQHQRSAGHTRREVINPASDAS